MLLGVVAFRQIAPPVGSTAEPQKKKMMNDKTKLVKEAKNDKASRCCWSAYQKKLGKMGLGEMLPNHAADAHSVNVVC